MPKILTLLPIALCFTAAAQTNSTPAPESKIYISHVTVIDTATGKEAPDQTVVISGGKIANIAKSKNLAAPASARIVDGRGKYLIPGLWDMHVHAFVFSESGTGTAPAMSPEMYFRLSVANGVTGLRDMGGPETPEGVAKLRQASSSALVPKLFVAGPVLDGAKPTWPQHSLSVSTYEQGREAVRKIKASGFDFVKVYSGLQREAYRGIAEESRAQSISFVGHVPASISALEASNAGQKSIEHFTRVLTACSSQEREIDSMFQDALSKGQSIFPLIAKAQQIQLASYDAGKARTLFAAFANNHTWQVPTFVQQRSFAYLDDPTFLNDPRLKYIPADVQKSWDPQSDFRMKYRTADDWKLAREVYEKSFVMAREMRREGVSFLAGTDLVNAYIFPGFSLHDELGLLVKAGLSNLDALQAATWNAAIFMNATDKYGTVAPGRIADLVLLDGDPLTDIHNTTRISAVFLNGKVYDRAALDLILKSAEESAKAANLFSHGVTLQEARDVGFHRAKPPGR